MFNNLQSLRRCLNFSRPIHSLLIFSRAEYCCSPNNNDAEINIFVHNFFLFVVFVTHNRQRRDEEKLVFFGLEQAQFTYCLIITALLWTVVVFNYLFTLSDGIMIPYINFSATVSGWNVVSPFQRTPTSTQIILTFRVNFVEGLFLFFL